MVTKTSDGQIFRNQGKNDIIFSGISVLGLYN